LYYDVASPVLLPALLVFVGANRFLFAVAHSFDPAGIDAFLNQGFFHRVGPAIAQRKIVDR
jgi:hypothetical protein